MAMVGKNDSITFHMTTPHTMQVTMSIGMATAIRDAIGNALNEQDGKVLVVIDMQEDFKISTQE